MHFVQNKYVKPSCPIAEICTKYELLPANCNQDLKLTNNSFARKLTNNSERTLFCFKDTLGLYTLY